MRFTGYLMFDQIETAINGALTASSDSALKRVQHHTHANVAAIVHSQRGKELCATRILGYEGIQAESDGMLSARTRARYSYFTSRSKVRPVGKARLCEN